MVTNMLTIVLITIAISCVSALPTPEEKAETHPDVGLTVIELIEKYGYPIEQHKNLETEDGYLLDMHRIPHGKNNADQTNKPVVFLMHGILCSSADWVNMGPEKGLAFLLADMGYDVWMGNARGNTWSRKHIKYNPEKDKEDFWSFSWNEVGIYDLPTMIDHILKVTGEEKIFYIGHSQGTTVYWVLMSEKPEYNDKIRLMVALAPIAYMSHMTNPLFQLLSLFGDTLEWLAEFIGVYEFLPSTEFFTILGKLACHDEAAFQDICSAVIFLIGGFDSEQLNKTMIPVIMTSTPAGSSTRQLLHYAQEIESGEFRKYDFGWVKNLIVYGKISPPVYEIANIKSPVALYYASNDWLAATQDVEQFNGELSNVVKSYLVPFKKFNHLDFLWAIDVYDMVYKDMLALMELY